MAQKKKVPVVNPAAEAAVIPPVATTDWTERPFIPQLLLAGAVLLVYTASISNGFVFFDDDKAILYNKALLNPSLHQFFTGQNLGMYAPFTWIAYWVGKGISGQEAWGYHLVSLALHLVNTLLVFYVMRLLTGKKWVSIAVALVFGVHPIMVEAVSWAAAMSTVLFATFYLGSAYAYLRWVQDSPGVTTRYGFSLVLFLMACLSKSAAVTLPLVLLVMDFYLNEKIERKHWLSKIPYLLLSIAFGLYTFSTRAQEGHDIAAASSGFGITDRLFMVCQTLFFYPIKMLAPLGYSIAYPFVKLDGVWPWTYYAAPVALAVTAFLIWKYWRNRKDYLLGVALYVLPLSVMLPFRTVGSFELRSDRYVYISAIGLLYLLFLALEPLKREVRNGILASLVLVFGLAAFRQTTVWKEGVALFENCVDKTPESSLCQCNLAYNELISLDFQGAVNHYSEALKYDPSTVEAYNGRGQAYLQLKKVPEALSDFSKAIQAGISTPKLYLNRGKCLVMLNKPGDAIPDLSKSLELEPKSFETWFFRAVAKEKTGDPAGAVEDYGKAIALKPDYLEALTNRGLLFMTMERYEEAIEDYTKATQVNPNLEMIWNNRAYAFYKKGDPGAGLADADRAIKLNTKYARAYQTRGLIYQALGQKDKAEHDLQTALQFGINR